MEELNARFADWYYIISDEVYHKIHLSRADVVKKKEKKEEDKDKAKTEGAGGEAIRTKQPIAKPKRSHRIVPRHPDRRAEQAQARRPRWEAIASELMDTCGNPFAKPGKIQ